MSTTELATTQRTDDVPAINTSTAHLLLEEGHLARLMTLAEIMSKGIATVPRHLQKNTGDCLAVAMQATQWRMNPFAVAQKTHVVNGTLGYEAQLVNAVVNTMAPTKDRINYEWFGDWSQVMGKFEERTSKKKVDEDTGQPLKYRAPNWTIKDEEGLGIKVWATMKGEDMPRVLELLLVQCRTRNSPLWADDPRQQIAYLAVKRWTRLYCPDVLLGVYTPDELEEAPPIKDMGAAEVVGVQSNQQPAELPEAQKAADKGRDAFAAWWKGATRETRNSLRNHMSDLERRVAEADAKRTVAAAAATPAPAAASAPAEAGAPAPAPAPAAGQVDDTWVASMEAAEKGGA